MKVTRKHPKRTEMINDSPGRTEERRSVRVVRGIQIGNGKCDLFSYFSFDNQTSLGNVQSNFLPVTGSFLLMALSSFSEMFSYISS
jgi:hypothetical protein